MGLILIIPLCFVLIVYLVDKVRPFYTEGIYKHRYSIRNKIRWYYECNPVCVACICLTVPETSNKVPKQVYKLFVKFLKQKHPKLLDAVEDYGGYFIHEAADGLGVPTRKLREEFVLWAIK